MNLAALNCAVIAGCSSRSPEVNMVSAPVIAGNAASRSEHHHAGQVRASFDGYHQADRGDPPANAVHCGHGVLRRQAALHPDQGHHHRRRDRAHMLYTTNEDVPGIIGTLGQTMGENGVNIANFTLGRQGEGMEAIALLYLDAAASRASRSGMWPSGM
jgi:D-3-phosphoglycerate dehydrogenase